MSAPPIRISDWKPRQSGTMRGFFSVTLPSGLELRELMLHHRDGAWWLSFPAKPLLGDGAVLRDERGKVRYGAALIAIAGRDARERFNQEVLDALRLAQPEVFAETEAGTS